MQLAVRFPLSRGRLMFIYVLWIMYIYVGLPCILGLLLKICIFLTVTVLLSASK